MNDSHHPRSPPRRHRPPRFSQMHGLGRHRRALDPERRRPHLARARAGHRAAAAPALPAGQLHFVQISDSHIGFNKPANTDVAATFRETIARINALPEAPEFLLHTGDLTHLAEAGEFDTLEQMLQGLPHQAGVLRARRTRHPQRQRRAVSRTLRQGHRRAPAGTASISKGVHFVGLVNVANITEGGLGVLGARAARLARRRTSRRSPARHADRGLRARAALDGLSEMGLGHGRRGTRRSRCSSASARSPCSTATFTRRCRRSRAT